VGGGQKVGVIVTGCAASVNVDEGMGLGKSGSPGTGCAVSVNVGEGMGLGESGSYVVVWKQPTNITGISSGIKIVMRFISYLL